METEARQNEGGSKVEARGDKVWDKKTNERQTNRNEGWLEGYVLGMCRGRVCVYLRITAMIDTNTR